MANSFSESTSRLMTMRDLEKSNPRPNLNEQRSMQVMQPAQREASAIKERLSQVTDLFNVRVT
jgi:hypothetical protein